jgi:hypothetical protein
MWRIRRFHVDSLGVRDNRLVDLTVDLTGTDGHPADSIVWLRNGAGKTTMLSLLIAHILPNRRDFLARRTGKQRTLEDLVLSGDTGHIACEWVDPTGTVLCTGAVYEWSGRHRPRDYNSAEGRRGFQRRFWIVRADDTVTGATFDTLPFFTRTGGRVDLAGFADHVRDLARAGVDAVVEGDSVTQWHAALSQRRFDPDLFRYFAIVNGTEGGLEHLFDKVDSPDAFARFLLQFVADPDRAVGIRNLLDETAVEIAKRPAYEADRDFSTDVAPLLEGLGGAHEKVVAAKAILDEVTTYAATLRRDLLDGVEAARAKESIERGTATEAGERLARASRERTAHRRLADTLRWAAARLAAVDAETAQKAAAESATRARNTADAWEAVAVVAEYDMAKATLEARIVDRDEAHSDAAPYVAAHTAAAKILAATLQAHIATTVETIGAGEARLAGLETERASTSTARDEVLGRRSGLRSERDQLEASVAAFAVEVDTAVTNGHLRASETPTDGHQRHQARHDEIKARLDKAIDERARLDGELAGLDTAAMEARRTATTVRSQATEKARAHETLVAVADELAARPRLVELAQTETVDVDKEGPALVSALTDAIAGTDARIIDERVDGAVDTRALDALTRTGLLPPRRSVTDLVETLSDLGHHAQPGWTYLAERVPVADHSDLIAHHPEVCEGVVVYDDPAVVAATLGEAEVTVDDAIVVARASTLSASTDGAHVRRIVVGPASALHDPAAAEAETEARQARADARDGTVAALKARRSEDVALRDRLEAFLKSRPEGGLAASAETVVAAEMIAAAREADADAAEADAAERRERIRRLDIELSNLRDRATAVAVSLSVTGGLAARADDIDAKQARLAVIAAELTVADATLDGLDGTLTRLDDTIGRLDRELDRRRGAVKEWRTEAAALPDPDGIGPGAKSLDVLRVRVDEARKALDELLDDADLSARIVDAEKALERIQRRLNRFTDLVLDHARLLAGTPDAADDDARHRARVDADRRLSEATAAFAVAEQAAKDAGRAAADAEPEPRSRVTLDPTPATVGEALNRAEEADRAATEWTRAETDEDQKQRDARARAEAAASRAGLLQDQADKLRTVEPAETGSGGPLPDDDAEVRRITTAIAERVDEAQRRHVSASSFRSQRIDQLRSFVADSRFVHLSESEHGRAIRQVRSMILGDELIERVAPNALDLAIDLVDRAEKIAGQLERIAQHKANVVARLAELVHVGLGDLARVSRLSELPAGIGPWAGRQFIHVGEKGGRPSQEQIDVRIGELVDDMVTGGRVEIEPVELLWRATHAAVGPGGFHASILKPTPEQGGSHVPVADMNKWSGGETLTASLLIFCVMTRLRAENRHGGARARVHAGVVPLDNPVGKANYREFLQLQRRVAAANGAQLLFWTGIGDLGAVTTFPRIVAMRKAISAARAGTAYVGQDEVRSQRVDDDLADLRVEVSAAARAEQGTFEL